MIKVSDVQYTRFRAPDLDKMEKFLTEFGLVRSARTDTTLFMRGTDGEHHIHITELGDPAYVGMGFTVANEADLNIIATYDGASEIHESDEPGGGKRVRLRDPDNRQIDIVWGMDTLEPIEVKGAYQFNSGSNRRRIGPFVRSYPRPSQVKRLGHIVLGCGDFKACQDFYLGTLGMLTSDYLHDNDDENVIKANFMRCDQGQDYVDHHTILISDREQSAMGHVAYEIEDWNDMAVGHHHLTNQGYTHAFGIGRHILGSQLFDYWEDPWGHQHEHWTDGDLLNEDTPAGSYPLHTARDVQWSPPR